PGLLRRYARRRARQSVTLGAAAALVRNECGGAALGGRAATRGGWHAAAPGMACATARDIDIAGRRAGHRAAGFRFRERTQRDQVVGAPRVVVGAIRHLPVRAAARLLLAAGSVGATLRRSRARDVGAGRLAVVVVGRGALVFFQAGARFLATGFVFCAARRQVP